MSCMASGDEKFDFVLPGSAPLDFPFPLVPATDSTTTMTASTKRKHHTFSTRTHQHPHHYPNMKNPAASDYGLGQSVCGADDPPRPPTQTNQVSKNLQMDNYRHTHHKAFTSLPLDFVPGPYDVICGRGAHVKKHPGNILFKQKIQEYLPAYAKANSKLQKSLIVSSVVEFFQLRSNSTSATGKTSGGGFVKESAAPRRTASSTCSSSSNRGEGVVVVWSAVSEYWAREKTGQAFRDQLSEFYKSATKTKRRRWKQQQEKAAAAVAAAKQKQEEQQQQQQQAVATTSISVPSTHAFSNSPPEYSHYGAHEQGVGDLVPIQEMHDPNHDIEDWWSLHDEEDPNSSLSLFLDDWLDINDHPHTQRYMHDVQTEKMELDRLQEQLHVPEHMYETHLESLLTSHNQRLLQAFKTDENIQQSLQNAVASTVTPQRMDTTDWQDPAAIWNAWNGRHEESFL